ncbi:MAG TPA: hypothetical protein VLC54_03465, partial [Anaeromyxobacter sp.]|nr:hypothetical protein [Anaeromyxobacter sp.]
VNRAIGIFFFGLTSAVGLWLMGYGVYAGLIRRRLQRPHRPGDFFVGRAAVVEGLFRIAVGGALIALNVWLLIGR